jgi:hypothetical protein
MQEKNLTRRQKVLLAEDLKAIQQRKRRKLTIGQ